MTPLLGRHLFIGDSITDCGRREDPEHLGDGYVRMVARTLADDAASASGDTTGHAAIPAGRVINTGIGGDRVRDLRRRWTADCLAHTPDVVTVLVGINDTWRRFDSGDPTSTEAFATDYRAILDITRMELPGVRIALMEPFVIPVAPDQETWREDLDPKIAVVHQMAHEYGAALIRLDLLFRAASGDPRAEVDGSDGKYDGWTLPAESLARDGVHPTPAGHRMIADAWLATIHGGPIPIV